MTPEDTAKLRDFMASDQHGANIEVNKMVVWVRNKRRMLNGQITFCLDICNPRMAAEHRSQGLFTDFLNVAESAGRLVFFQDVPTARMQAFLTRRGYTEVKDAYNPDWLPSYYKEPPTIA